MKHRSKLRKSAEAVILTFMIGLMPVASAEANPPNTWIEIGDAGETPDTFQQTYGAGELKTIIGEFGSTADTYILRIEDTSAFSAKTTPEDNIFDFFLALIELSTLKGVIANNDIDTDNGNFAPTISFTGAVGDLTSFTAGYYVLFISVWGVYPANASNNPLWNTEDTVENWTRLGTPDGPGAGAPYSHAIGEPYHDGLYDNLYTILLTGAFFTAGAGGPAFTGGGVNGSGTSEGNTLGEGTFIFSGPPEPPFGPASVPEIPGGAGGFALLMSVLSFFVFRLRNKLF